MLHEILRAPLPRKVQVFHEEAGHDHAHAVVHPPGGQQLAHARVDDGIPGAARAPRGETFFRASVGVDGHRVHLGLQVLPRRARLVMQHVGVELAPPQLAAVVVVVLVGFQFGQQLARVQHAEAQVRRQHAAAVAIGVVAFFFVLAERVGSEVLPSRPRGFFAGLRQLGGEFRIGGNTVALDVGCAAKIHVLGCGQRLRPTVGDPTARERREHRVRRAVGLAHRAGVDGVRRADANQLHSLRSETLLHLTVTLRAVGAEVGTYEDRVGAGLFRETRHDVERVAVTHHDGSVHGGVERANVAVQKRETRGTRAVDEQRVEHEQRRGHAVRERGIQRGMVGKSQVATKPDDCRAHGCRTYRHHHASSATQAKHVTPPYAIDHSSDT